MIWLIAAAYAETLSTTRLASMLTAARSATAGSLVLVVGTGDDEEVVREAVESGLMPGSRVVRGSGLAPTALERSRANAGVACAIGLSAADDGRWQVVPVGACGMTNVAPSPVPEVLPPPSAPRPASTPTRTAKPPPAPAKASKPSGPVVAPVEPVAVVVPAPARPPPTAPWNVALLDSLLALDDHPARRQALAAAMASDPEHTVRAAEAMAVVTQLETTDRTDPSVVRFFLEAALSDDADTRTAAIDAASRRGDPPRAVVVVVTTEVIHDRPAEPVAPAAAPAPFDRLGALRAYNARHLARGVSSSPSAAPFPPTLKSAPPWAIYQGGSALLTTAQFADAVSDASLLEHLRDQRTGSRIGGGALVVGGALIGAAGFGMLDTDDPTAPALLVGAGGLALAGGIGWIAGVPAAQRRVDRYYRVDVADVQIEVYNAELRSTLGVSEEDALPIDLQAAGPTVTPWVSVGSLGVAGTF